MHPIGAAPVVAGEEEPARRRRVGAGQRDDLLGEPGRAHDLAEPPMVLGEQLAHLLDRG